MDNNDSATDVIGPDQLRITVEMGDEYTPSAELEAALSQLRAALDPDPDDVVGFGADINVSGGLSPRSFVYTTKPTLGYSEMDIKIGKKM